VETKSKTTRIDKILRNEEYPCCKTGAKINVASTAIMAAAKFGFPTVEIIEL
jgi:hypothetical protein